MKLTKDQVQQILQNKPQGTSDLQILTEMTNRGFEFEGVDMNAARQFATQQTQQVTTPQKRTISEKVLDFTGGKEIGQGLGQALANPKIAKQQEQTQQQQSDIQAQLLQRIKEKKAVGEDTSRLEQALGLLGQEISRTGQETGQLLNQEELTAKQVLGDALQLGGTVASLGAGSSSSGLKSGVLGKTTTPAVTGTIQGIKQGFITGAKSGATFGGISGVATGLQEDKTFGQSLVKGVGGAAMGGLTGGILGGILGGVSGRIEGSRLRKQVLDAQVGLGEKTSPAVQEKARRLAIEQGFADTDIDFINSMKPTDKSIASKMINLAEKASKDKRAIERPIDIVGDNMIKRVKFIESVNKTAGKEVDTVAKSLRGQPVDVNSVSQQAQSLIDDLGIRRTPQGGLDFSNSVFKNTPELQTRLRKFISQVPTGQADAYDVHIFKKSIDELVNYGTKGEGLKGNAERILKALRSTADDALDTTFPAYNDANTKFRVTKEVLDEANDLFGRKTGIGKERGGQLLRSVFSNNTQRPRVLQLVEALDNTSKTFGKQFDDNLIDQALFTEILEDVYGTQATTSLQGQVARAVKGTQRVIEGVRNPLQGVGDLVASGAEKIMGISPENKKKILSSLLR